MLFVGVETCVAGNLARTACLSSLVGRVPWLCFSLTFRCDSPFAPGGRRWHNAFCRCYCSERCARSDLQVLVFFHIVWMRRHRGTLSLWWRPFRPSSRQAQCTAENGTPAMTSSYVAGQRDQLATEMGYVHRCAWSRMDAMMNVHILVFRGATGASSAGAARRRPAACHMPTLGCRPRALI